RLIFFLDRYLERQLLRQPYLRKRTVEELLKIDENFGIAEVQLANAACPWIDKTLGEIRLRDQGVMVLSIRRTDGNMIRAPRGTDFLRRGDILLVYGRPRFIRRLIEQAT
ncbi:MAG TPA: potassium transporter TrkA, partial [Firmicutes bacterium]|nr:potassium transporter TrkA [Bacillota bacterium]